MTGTATIRAAGRTRTRWSRVAAVVLAAAAAVIYLPRLGSAPIYLAPDEVVVGVTAHSLATTARDPFHGRLLPLYVEFNRVIVNRSGVRETRNSWLPGMIFYAAAAAVKLLNVSEFSIRLPTALLGIASVLLTYFVARRMFRSDAIAALAAALLIVTPSHFIHSRLAADYLFPVPFMLGWMLLVLKYLDERRIGLLWAAGVILGVGVYSYAASLVMMPVYVLVTFAVLMLAREPVRAYVAIAGGFLVPAAVCIPWLATHPAMAGDVLAKYDLRTGSGITILQTIRSSLVYERIGDVVSRYWAFFDPRFLFFTGPMEPMFSTRLTGVFVVAVAPLLAAGILTAVRTPLTPAVLLLLLGFVTAPIAALLVNINDAIYRALEMLPCAAMLAALGAGRLLRLERPKPRGWMFIAAGTVILVFAAWYTRHVLGGESRVPGATIPLVVAGVFAIALGIVARRLAPGQVMVAVLLALAAAQFAFFYRDYFTGYRARTAYVFSGNIRGAYEEAVREADAQPTPVIYLGEIGPYSYGALYWKFYMQEWRRPDLESRVHDLGLFYPGHVRDLPAGSLIVNNAGYSRSDDMAARMEAEGLLKRTATIYEPDGSASFMLLRRLPAR